VEAPEKSLDRLEREVAELRASRMRLVVADAAERRRLERELHDGPQQHLVGLAVNIQLARDLVETDPVAAKTLLGQLGGDVERALDETSRLAQRIYPPLLESGGLAAALRAAAVGVGARVAIEVGPLAGCPPEQAGAAYFSCLEVLERAGEGAQAEIEIRMRDGAVTFEVVTTSLSDGALGELGDRVEALGGRLTVQPGPDGAVRVYGGFEARR